MKKGNIELARVYRERTYWDRVTSAGGKLMSISTVWGWCPNNKKSMPNKYVFDQDKGMEERIEVRS